MPISNDNLTLLDNRLDALRDEMIAFQQELTAVVALGPGNHGAGEWARARFLQEKMRGFGLTDITEHNAPDDRVEEKTRPNMVVRLAGSVEKPMVWVMAHMDVVPPGDEKQWETQPFEATVRDGRIYGRGTEDNQQGLVSALFAMKALVDEKIPPTTGVGLILVSDEETGNRYGIEHLLQTAPDLVAAHDLVIVPDAGVPDGAMVEVAEKSILWLRFHVRGKQVHASTPQAGVNAHRAGARLVVALDEALHHAYDRRDPVFDPPMSTFEPTMRESNVPNINTIPGEDVLCFDCRVLPDIDLEEVLATARQIASEVERDFGVQIELSTPQRVQAAPATPVDAPVVVALSEAIREVRKIEPRPMGIGGGTVAAEFRARGIPAAVWSTMDDLAHQPNEYCVIENMVEDAKVFARVFARKG